jgi:hypothetical protein
MYDMGVTVYPDEEPQPRKSSILDANGDPIIHPAKIIRQGFIGFIQPADWSDPCRQTQRPTNRDLTQAR